MENPNQGNTTEQRLENGDILRTKKIKIGPATVEVKSVFTTRRFLLGDEPETIQYNKDFEGVESEIFYEISGPKK